MRLLSGLLFVLAAATVHPQTVADALRMPGRTLSATDIPAGYRAVSLGSGDSLGGLGLFGLSAFTAGEGSPDDAQGKLFLSLLGATFVDPDEFAALLDGKRPRIRGYALDLSGTIAASPRSAKTPRPIFSETWIEAGRVLQWSPRPTLTKESLVKAFDDAPRPAADETTGLSNVKQVALGMILYAGDYDDKFPTANSTAAAQKGVDPYVKNKAIWSSPSGGRVLYNTALSGVSQTSIEDIAGTLLVWEEKPYPDGHRAVGYTDGHVKRLDETQWQALWTAELRRRAASKAAPAVRKTGKR